MVAEQTASKDQALALRSQDRAAQAAAPVDTGLSLEKIRFRYAVSGSNPPWKSLRAFDDREKVYSQFLPGIAPGERSPCSSLVRRVTVNSSTTVSARRTTPWTGCLARPSCA